jgi:hypothetical protein
MRAGLGLLDAEPLAENEERPVRPGSGAGEEPCRDQMGKALVARQECVLEHAQRVAIGGHSPVQVAPAVSLLTRP